MGIRHWLRVIHRNLGFLVVGISLVYGISGIYLNHLGGGDPAFRTVEASLQLPPNLTLQSLETAWNEKKNLPKINKIMSVDETHLRLMLEGGIGIYNSTDGHIDYELHHKRIIIYWINRLHYSRVNGWTPVADIFAGSLIFLAFSGLFITRGKHGIKGYGKWYLIAGLLIPLAFILI
ncbi:MAG: peptidase [Dysgonamonadaceae bacterium]|jgi:hypothetical protein|nr:peptidase [Dysgonamonadaceae bacterium]